MKGRGKQRGHVVQVKEEHFGTLCFLLIITSRMGLCCLELLCEMGVGCIEMKHHCLLRPIAATCYCVEEHHSNYIVYYIPNSVCTIEIVAYLNFAMFHIQILPPGKQCSFISLINYSFHSSFSACRSSHSFSLKPQAFSP